MKIAGACFFLVFVAISVEIAESCKCLRRHSQLIYHSDDYVLVVEVRLKLPGTPNNVEYSVIIREVLKKKDDLQIGRKIVLSAFVPCAPTLAINKRYVVSGKITNGKFILSVCAFSFPIEKFTTERRELFLAYGTEGKTCEVPAQLTAPTKPNPKQCLIDSNNKIAECQYDHGVCVPIRGRCGWRRSIVYNKCLTKP